MTDLYAKLEKEKNERWRAVMEAPCPADNFTKEQIKHMVTVFPTGAHKEIGTKLRFDLIPPEVSKALAQVYTLGAGKYEDRNWEKGLPFSAIIGALKRHLNEFEMGEYWNKADGDLEHGAHILWWAAALVTFMRRDRKDLNDLPAYGDVNEST